MEQQRVLGGRYLLKDKVGSGGMATVYRAQDQVLDRTVAVKIMLPQYASDATFAARFKQEAQAAAGLQSPYIVGVYDWGKDGDTYYIVMEYLRGTDLKSGIRSHGALDPKKVAQIGSQICAALSVAHKHEIVHRDIKPQNIMVQPDGNIKVMDFGIARAKNSHLTQDNNVLGTAHYVSPEQTRGQELGPTSDIYSLGVVMYECATGRVPFDGDDAISVALKQVNEMPVPPSQINGNVDSNLERIILRCMEKDPANRFQSADELRSVLNTYLSGRAVDVPEPTRVISPVGGMGATETRVMSDSTQMMARPAAAQTTARPAARNAGRPSSPASTNGFEPVNNGMGKGKIAAIVVGVIAVIAFAVFAAGQLFGGSGETVDMPSLIGWEQEAAVDNLRSLGITNVEITQEFNDEQDEGKVCDQTPDGGRSVHTTDKVTLVISKGEKPAETTTVPKLVGRTQEAAEAALKQANLKGKAITEANDADKGEVFEQSIDEGEEVEVDTVVEYKVSAGPDEQNVPGVLGMTKSKASNTLSDAGFKVAYAEDYSDEYDKGLVMAQSHTGTAAPDTEITITISKGKKPGNEDDDSGNGSDSGSGEETGGSVSVPSLSGMTKAQAESALKSAGFVPSFSYADGTNEGVHPDYVISWSPNGSAKKGDTINVVVAYGEPSA